MTTVTQKEVTTFYDQLVFPSKSSHRAYEELVPLDSPDAKYGDFGCGESLFIEVFRKNNLDAVFVDISPRVIERIDYGEKICASLTKIPLPDNSVDHSFCIGVVHHIPDMEKSISELIRVTAPAGELFLGVYAHGTAQAKLRHCFDAAPRPIRPLVRFLSRIAIWIKNNRNGLSFFGEQTRKRVSDLLDTPLVRYQPADRYEEIIKRANGRVDHIQRISQMNILVITKNQ